VGQRRRRLVGGGQPGLLGGADQHRDVAQVDLTALAQHGGVTGVGALDVEQREVAGVVEVEAHAGLGALADTGQRIGVGVHRRRLGLAQPESHAADELGEQLLLGREVPVEQALGDAGAAADVLDAGGRVPVGGEQLGGGIDQLLLALATVLGVPAVVGRRPRRALPGRGDAHGVESTTALTGGSSRGPTRHGAHGRRVERAPMSASAPVLPGAEPWSHHALDPTAGAAPGVLVLHGFTGNPSSMRGLAESFASEGMHVELPRLPGHGTTMEDMVPTGWSEWTAEVEAAYQLLAARAGKVVVAGLSMGGSLALWAALTHPEVAGIVCINPATEPQGAEVLATLDEMLAAGTAVMPGIGSDIADPEMSESAYEGVPLLPLRSFIVDGLTPLADRYGELTMPLLLFTSRQDHVVEPVQSEHLAARYGGSVDHRWLESSYHVATMDFDRDVINVEAAAFAKQVTES
jgi:carboxylesterase